MGLSLAVALAKQHEVSILDINKEKVELINKKVCPLKDSVLQEELSHSTLSAYLSNPSKYKNQDMIILALPIDFDEKLNKFDDKVLFDVVKEIVENNQNCIILLKSTVSIGTTKALRSAFKTDNIFYSPEFLREGKGYFDVTHPDRVVVGCDKNFESQKDIANKIADVLKMGNETIPTLITGLNEAESIKLFSNTYLALRVAYFNEIDSFALLNGLDAKDIIDGVCKDSRIGNFYNNPSFGYGGYCLPKDSKQLNVDLKDSPHSIVKSTIESNLLRKQLIVNHILEYLYKHNKKTVGIHRLTMKSDSDNFRQSAILDIVDMLTDNGVTVYLYEPLLKEGAKIGKTIRVIEIEDLKEKSDIIITNRKSYKLKDVQDKVFTRDIFEIN